MGAPLDIGTARFGFETLTAFVIPDERQYAPQEFFSRGVWGPRTNYMSVPVFTCLPARFITCSSHFARWHSGCIGVGTRVATARTRSRSSFVTTAAAAVELA